MGETTYLLLMLNSMTLSQQGYMNLHVSGDTCGSQQYSVGSIHRKSSSGQTILPVICQLLITHCPPHIETHLCRALVHTAPDSRHHPRDSQGVSHTGTYIIIMVIITIIITITMYLVAMQYCRG